MIGAQWNPQAIVNSVIAVMSTRSLNLTASYQERESDVGYLPFFDDRGASRFLAFANVSSNSGILKHSSRLRKIVSSLVFVGGGGQTRQVLVVGGV
jgi:hypothetical protein